MTRQLEQRETTCNARLWFSDPQNAAWTPIYTRPPAAEADRLDAERYRWLRDPMSGSTRHDPKVYKDGPQEDVEWAYGEELDTIVDEAMARDFAQRAKWEKKAMSPTTTIAALAASKEKP
ncbi:hypothetical protein [Herbaspirillum seropedicae]|uniref:hypothetical protein n=1 Tax=Herbaspirillum seropedicae TaxID=964 RepID=UPI003FCD407D